MASNRAKGRSEPSGDGAGESARERAARLRGEAISRLIDDLAGSGVVGEALAQIARAGERALRAPEAALGALRVPTEGDIDRLDAHMRTISDRLDEIEDTLELIEDRVAALERGGTAGKAAKRPTAGRTAGAKPASRAAAKAPKGAKLASKAARKPSAKG